MCVVCLSTVLTVLTAAMGVSLYVQMQELRKSTRTISEQFQEKLQAPDLNPTFPPHAQDIFIRKMRSLRQATNQCTCVGNPGCTCQEKGSRKKDGLTKTVPVAGHYVSRQMRSVWNKTKRLACGSISSQSRQANLSPKRTRRETTDTPPDGLEKPVTLPTERKGDKNTRNRGIPISGDDVKLIFLRQVAQMNGIEKPFNKNSGNYRVRKSGMYLLYLQVVFDVRATEGSIKLVSNSKTIFQCVESDYGVEYRRRNCKLFGMQYLQRNDELSILTSGHLRIHMAEEYTNFGATLLN
ncbi:hypothetical protein ScPMuIL_018606 [Solemya velum]